MNTKKPILQRLMQRSIRQGECLIWTGARNNCGYGLIRFNGKSCTVHRVSFTVHKGEIPAGMVIMHACDNRLCVNPEHLSIGTHSDNTRDMDSKARCKRTKGSQHHKATLTEEAAAEIRRRYKPYCRANSTYALAREFSVSQSTIKAVLQGTTWRSA